MRRVGRALRWILLPPLALYLTVMMLFGRGERLEDRTAAPLLAGTALEKVADLDLPPGNIAVSATGRIFFTFHPEGGPPVQLAEIVDGKPVAWPNEAIQSEAGGELHFQSLLSIRIDRQNRLWALDFAHYATGTPRLLAFDLETKALVHRHDFGPGEVGLGDMLNDFQVDAAGEAIFIAEASPFLRTPAIVVYDVVRQKARRVLEGHASVTGKPYVIQADGGREMVILGAYALVIGVDSIALSRDGEWLAYAPVNHDRLFRIRAADLRDETLSADGLAAKVEDFAAKTLSDGMSSDDAGNVYLTDMEHSAILRVTPERKLETLVKTPTLRWPDGLSFGPDGWLYVTASDLQDVIFESSAHVRESAPFQIYRFRPGGEGTPGH